MTVRRRIALTLLWALSLVLTAAWTTTRAQQTLPIPGVPGRIIAGDDLGFRVEGQRDGAPTGTLVVRIDGEWVEVRTSLKLVPLK